MLFSEPHQIKRLDIDDWFDPILDKDIKLFIDPFYYLSILKGFCELP